MYFLERINEFVLHIAQSIYFTCYNLIIFGQNLKISSRAVCKKKNNKVCIFTFVSFILFFRFWVLVTFSDEVMKVQKYYVIFVYILQVKMGNKNDKVWVFQKFWKNLRRTFDKSVVFCARNSVSTCQKVDEDF
jgi:hypothetical protein